MGQTTGQAVADQQISEAMAAEQESLSLECRADAARFQRLLAPENQGRRSNRTSLWRRIGPSRWPVFHHQGTIMAG
jgi:hypothetical protein